MEDKDLKELEHYAGLEGSEVGDAVNLLINLHRYADFLSPAFCQAIEKEIKEQLLIFQTCTNIIKKTEVITTTREELEWTHYISYEEDEE